MLKKFNLDSKKDEPKYLVYSLSLANWLCRHGHNIINIEDNHRHPKYKVFAFFDSWQLRNDIASFSSGKRV